MGLVNLHSSPKHHYFVNVGLNGFNILVPWVASGFQKVKVLKVFDEF